MKSSRTVWGMGGLLLVAASAGALWLSSHLPSTSGDELVPLPGDALVTFARIQTDLNRAAAGRPAPAPEPAADPLEGLGDALRALLTGNTTKAARQLDAVEAEIDRRVPSEQQVVADATLADKAEWLVSYFELLPKPPHGRSVKLETAGFVRFAILLRKVDALLLADMLPALDGYDLVARQAKDEPSVFAGMWLRFPCRVAEMHRPALEEAARRLGKLAGPLTDCPVPTGHETDFALQERIARDPAGLLAEHPEGPAAPPRDLRTSLMAVAATGTLADIGGALEAGADPLRADARGRTALHYLLGNAKLKPGERSAAVKLLY